MINPIKTTFSSVKSFFEKKIESTSTRAAESLAARKGSFSKPNLPISFRMPSPLSQSAKSLKSMISRAVRHATSSKTENRSAKNEEYWDFLGEPKTSKQDRKRIAGYQKQDPGEGASHYARDKEDPQPSAFKFKEDRVPPETETEPDSLEKLYNLPPSKRNTSKGVPNTTTLEDVLKM